MLVSVVITTYNRDYETLERAIKSVKNQTYNNIEIILVNDTPEKNEKFEMISKYIKEEHKDILYITNKVNKGACYSRNIGAEKSRGEYIAFLDDDDEWEESKLEKQVQVMNTSNYVAVTVAYSVIINDKKRINIKSKFFNKNKVIKLNDLKNKNLCGGASAPMLRRKVFFEIGKFDESMPAAQDYDLWIRLAQKGDIYYIDEPLQKYYINEGERISNHSDKKIVGYLKLVDKYQNIFLNNKKFLMNRYVVIAYQYLKANNKEKAKYYYKKAINPTIPTLMFIHYSLKIIKESLNVK